MMKPILTIVPLALAISTVLANDPKPQPQPQPISQVQDQSQLQSQEQSQLQDQMQTQSLQNTIDVLNQIDLSGVGTEPSQSVQTQTLEDNSSADYLALALSSFSNPAQGHDCFVPTRKRGRGFGTPVFSRPATLELNEPCWEFYKLVTKVQFLLQMGERQRALELLVGEGESLYVDTQCVERQQRLETFALEECRK